MTIFDAIKYHVSDIYNESEITSLPDDLVISWLSSCISDEDNIKRVAAYNRKKAVMYVRLAVANYAESFYNKGIKCDLEDMVKAKFLKMLRRTIAEYDTVDLPNK
jgi:hypothetical protein